MKLIKVSIISIFILVLMGLFLTSTDFNFKKNNRNEQRKLAVNQLAQLISDYHSTFNYYLPLGLKPGNYQIGTASNGCSLQTNFCQIDHDACVNLNYLTTHLKSDVPSDIKIGHRSRTGYMLTVTDQSQVTFTACGSEGEQIIAQSATDLPFISIDQTATSSLILKDDEL